MITPVLPQCGVVVVTRLYHNQPDSPFLIRAIRGPLFALSFSLGEALPCIASRSSGSIAHGRTHSKVDYCITIRYLKKVRVGVGGTQFGDGEALLPNDWL